MGIGDYLFEKLEEVMSENENIIAHRGIGLMQGLEFKVPVGPIINKCMDNGLILINAGTNIIRFLPPLVISKKDVDDMLVILKKCL